MFVVIGTATVDLIVRGMPNDAGLGDGFRAENLVFCDDPLLMLMGGNGGNSAIVFSKLGVPTAICSSVGQDDFGDWLAQKLAAKGVILDGLVRSPDLATSSSTILLNSMENQSVFHHKGATDVLAVTAVQEGLYAQAEVLLASSYPLFPQMRAGGFERALQMTHEAGGITALDIGPAIGEPATIKEIAPLFPHLDYLIGNEHELKVCAGAAAWEMAADDLLASGCPCVVIKRGADGAVVRSQEFNLSGPPFPVSAKFAVGAGDSFNAGFLYALWANRPSTRSISSEKAAPSTVRSLKVIESAGKNEGERPQELRHGQHELLEAVRFGNAVAALVMDGKKGVLGAPTPAEVEAFLHA